MKNEFKINEVKRVFIFMKNDFGNNFFLSKEVISKNTIENQISEFLTQDGRKYQDTFDRPEAK